jgi:molybdopterin-binding protein
MKISARDTLPGTMRKIEPGAVNAEVSIERAYAVGGLQRHGCC